MVHIVQVISTWSTLPDSTGSTWPSRPMYSTGTGLAATRLAASFRPAVAGSTARTLFTSRG